MGVACRAQTISQQREAAVLKARAGRTAEAEGLLRALLANRQDDGFVAMDLLTILQQDRKPAEAIAVYEASGQNNPPDYAMLAATRAYRDLGRFAEAESLARSGLRRFPNDATWPLLLSLVLTDQGKTSAALQVLKQSPVVAGVPVERLLAEAYAYRRSGDSFAALRAYSAATRRAPASASTRTETAAVLRDLAAPYAAAEIGGMTPTIAADQAAAMVRWGGDIRPSDPAKRYEGTDAAIARLDALLAATAPEDSERRRRLRLDRIVALQDRLRMREVVDEGAALAAQAPLPPYAEKAYASALLYLRRPQEARAAYEHVLAQSPRDVEARYGVFYAAVEAEDFKTAYAAIDALIEDQGHWRSFAGDPTRYPNAERAAAEIAAAEARFYGNQLGEAWDRITRLSSAAPASGSIRLASYHIANARGWARLAAQEAEIAASLEPRDVSIRIALVEVAIAQFRFADAKRALAQLQALYPDNLAVQRLARDLDAKQRWLLEVEVRPSSSTGGGLNANGQEMFAQSLLYSPPINDNFRLFAMGGFASATPPEGYVSRGQMGGGLEWRYPNLRATAFATANTGSVARPGGGATLEWAVTDQLLLGVAAQAFSPDTPLRGLYYGITSDEYSVRAEYRWHESRSLGATFAYQPFTDGNQRTAAGLVYSQRLINLPHFDLTGRAELSNTTNTLTNTFYYSPASDVTATVGFLAEHMVWRRYDRSFVQALSVDAGPYAEAGYATSWVGVAAYEHRWRFDPLTELRYGVSFARRIYDGNEERTIAVLVGLRQRI